MFLITLPLPPRILHPNSRGHWAPKAKAKKEQRELAHVLGLQEKYKLRVTPRPPLKPVRFPLQQPVIHVSAFHKAARVRDRDGLISSLKSAIDGLADSGLIGDDSGVRWGDVEFYIDRKNPRVELHLARGPSQP